MINKYVVLTVDENLSYLYLLPFICKSWQLQGWKCKIAFNNIKNIDLILDTLEQLDIDFEVEFIEKQSTTINKALYTQCHRLYMAEDLPEEGYILMSDADMFIASNFLNRDYDKVNSFGHDLTGYGQIPMCYVGMTGKKWKELMGDFDVEKDLATFARKESGDFYIAWSCDQDILTNRIRTILGYRGVNFIKRGNDQTNSGLPIGRWDRFNWIKPNGQIHDCHLSPEGYTDGGTERLIDMCKTIYPETNWDWILDYQTKFKQIYGV